MKKLVVVFLTMVLCCAVSMASAWNLENTVFPLEETETFTVLSSGYRFGTLSEIDQNEDWKSLCEALNIKFDFKSLGAYDAPETRSNLQMRLMNEDYGDAIMSFYIDTLSVADIAELGAAGVLLPLEDYMSNPEVMPNFYKNVYTKYPHVLTNMKSNDGHIYAFYGVSETAGYNSGEALLQVNEAWLESWKAARGVDHSPETLAEFEDMLVYFRDSDLNGNGVADEIPYMIAQGAFEGTATLEHALGMFGISTKDSALDMNIMIDDDKCYFAHTTDAYKAGLKTFADWYEKKLVWQEIFTGNADTITNEFAQAVSKIGVVNTCTNMAGFVGLMPPAVEGYSPRYHMHPAMRAGVNAPYAVITKNCKNPELFASFIDLMFDFDNSMLWRFGSENQKNGTITRDEMGRYVYTADLMVPPAKGMVEDSKRAIHDYIMYASNEMMDIFSANVDINTYFGGDKCVEAHNMFAENGLWNPTGSIWPRCALLEEDAEDYAFYYTDVSAVLAEYRAKFITGQLDVDAEWDNFQKKMKNLGIDEMQQMIQRAYDAYLSK